MNLITDPQEDYHFTLFRPPITNILPETPPVSLNQVFQIIQGSELKEKTDQIRQESDKDLRSELKRSFLPYVTFSGIFDKRKDDGLVKPSGLIICDLDHLPDPVGAKKAILESLMPALLFRSPSGDGLKIVFAIDLAVGEYTKYFEAIRIHFKTELHLILDNGKDLSRACFLCHDPDVFYSSSPVILDQDFLDTFLEDLPLAQDPNIITDIITEVPLKKSEIISGSP